MNKPIVQQFNDELDANRACGNMPRGSALLWYRWEWEKFFGGNIDLTNCFSEDKNKVLNQKTKKVSAEVDAPVKLPKGQASRLS